MSIWTDIHRRSNGNQARKEDYLDIYHHESMIKTLYTDAYAGCATYEIITNGAYPAIMITFYGDYILNSIDRQVVKLKAPRPKEVIMSNSKLDDVLYEDNTFEQYDLYENWAHDLGDCLSRYNKLYINDKK